MGILTIVLLARIVARLAAVDIPIPVSYAMTSAVLAFLIFVLALLKNLTDDYSTWASYVGVVLAFLIAAGAWMEIQAAGGMEHEKSDPELERGHCLRSDGCGAFPTSPTPPAAPALLRSRRRRHPRNHVRSHRYGFAVDRARDLACAAAATPRRAHSVAARQTRFTCKSPF